MLSPYRVLDLSDESGLLCGQILADLGADVIQVEPRGGSPARRLGPYRGGEAGIERSLFWAAYTRNKRGIALDLEDEADRALLLRLAAGADFLIESERPGRMARLGLAYEDLARIQPGIVYVSITPFGQTGPKAHWRGTRPHPGCGGRLRLSLGRRQRPAHPGAGPPGPRPGGSRRRGRGADRPPSAEAHGKRSARRRLGAAVGDPRQHVPDPRRGHRAWRRHSGSREVSRPAAC